MTLKWLFTRRYEQNRGEGEGGEGAGETRESPAEVNERVNRRRLDRINDIGRRADGRRSREMRDVDGDRETGAFSGGEFDESPEAREAAQQREADEAEQNRLELAEREREYQRREAEELQGEGGEGETNQGDGEATTTRSGGDGSPEENPDERVVDGVRYYRTMVDGNERWLTLTQLREGVSNGIATRETLQRAQEALRSAAQPPVSPERPAGEDLDDEDLENVILSAGMGDAEAVKKLVSVIRRPAVSREDIDRRVSQRIATQRAVDQAESAQADLLGNKVLEPEFRRRLREYGSANPSKLIIDCYQAVGDQMRKDFAPMIGSSGKGQGSGQSKQERKREIVSPPRSAGRQPARPDEDREVPVGDQIDAIARSRGQARAHRVRRA